MLIYNSLIDLNSNHFKYIRYDKLYKLSLVLWTLARVTAPTYDLAILSCDSECYLDQCNEPIVHGEVCPTTDHILLLSLNPVYECESALTQLESLLKLRKGSALVEVNVEEDLCFRLWTAFKVPLERERLSIKLRNKGTELK